MSDFMELARKWDEGSPKAKRGPISFCDYCGEEIHEEPIEADDKVYCSETCQGEDEAEQRNGEAGIPSWPMPRYYYGNYPG